MYAKQVFWEAVNALATSDASIQKRLATAAMPFLKIVYVKPKYHDLPEECHEEFEAIWHELTQEGASGADGSIETTTAKLSVEQSRKLAERIVSMFTQIMGGL